MTRMSRFLFGLVLLAIAGAACAGDEDPRLAQSRNIAVEFGDTLRAALQSAVADGGPVHAVGVCSEVAPGIASELSRRYGAAVSRTSLRLRNSANLPSAWQEGVLRDFDEDGNAATAEFFERREDGRFRYMRAIPTGGLCLACHGDSIAAEIEAVLERDYPHDRARGYSAGDIRGAFVVEWPAPPAPAD